MSTVPRGRAGLAPLLGLVAVAVVVGLLWLLGGGGSSDDGVAGGGSSTATSSAATSSAATSDATQSGASTPDSGLDRIAESELPEQARETLDLIRAGGPYPYGQDDETFFNREGILPAQDRGYYREYTVETPGSDDRGARRIVGGEAGDRYWTDDHYASFAQIEEGS